MAKIHIGKKIKEVWKDSRLKGTEFAAMINKDRQVIYDIFDRETIDTGLLLNIGKVLNYDFFSYYSQHSRISEVQEKQAAYGYATREELLALTHAVQNLARTIEEIRDELPEKSQGELLRGRKKYGKRNPGAK